MVGRYCDYGEPMLIQVRKLVGNEFSNGNIQFPPTMLPFHCPGINAGAMDKGAINGN